MRNLAIAGAVLALGAGATGCGRDRAELPDLTKLGGAGKTERFTSDDGSVSFRYPRTWIIAARQPPAVAEISSGGAVATVYGYPRTDLGTDPASVEEQRKRIVASLERRAPGFLVFGASVTEVDGSPAVQVRGRGRIGEKVVRALSTHVFSERVEWVIDAYAARGKFAQADRIAFEPLLDSIELADRVGEGGGEGEAGA